MKTSQDQVTIGDYGINILIDTELADLTGLTLKLLFYNQLGTLVATKTGTDGGDGPIGKQIAYTTLSTDTNLFTTAGQWKIVPQVSSSGSTVLRHGTPPHRVSVVAVGKEF